MSKKTLADLVRQASTHFSSPLDTWVQKRNTSGAFSLTRRALNDPASKAALDMNAAVR